MPHFYSIGGLGVTVDFADDQANSVKLISSMSPFEIDETSCTDVVLSVIVDDNTPSLPINEQTLVRDFDTGNGMTRVDRMADGSYQYICRDIMGRKCALIVTSPDFSVVRCALRGDESMRSFGLTNALMLTYAYRSSFFSTLLIHASTVRYDNHAFAFTAKSGTGKSTHVAQWLANIEGCDMINDDNPIIRVENGDAFLYGSPWSGKTPCYRSVRVRLGAIALIRRASENNCVPLSKMEALSVLLTACSSMRWEERLSDNLYGTLSQLLNLRQVYAVECQPNADAALTACRVLSNSFTTE